MNGCGNEEFDSKFFDEASAAWRANKTQKERCHYVYKCDYTHKNGRVCGYSVKNMEVMRCGRHSPLAVGSPNVTVNSEYSLRNRVVGGVSH